AHRNDLEAPDIRQAVDQEVRRLAWGEAQHCCGPIARRVRCAPSPPLGRGFGVRGFETHRESLTPHPTPLPMGEGADRVRRIAVTRSKTCSTVRLCNNAARV